MQLAHNYLGLGHSNDFLDMRNDFLFTGMAVIRNQCYGMTSCGTGGIWQITKLDKLDTALSDFVALGVRTNIAFLRNALAHDSFLGGEVDTDFLDSTDPSELEGEQPDEALLVAIAASAQRLGMDRVATAGAEATEAGAVDAERVAKAVRGVLRGFAKKNIDLATVSTKQIRAKVGEKLGGADTAPWKEQIKAAAIEFLSRA